MHTYVWTGMLFWLQSYSYSFCLFHIWIKEKVKKAKLKRYINAICIWASTRIRSIFCSSSNVDDSWKKITLHLLKEMHLSLYLCAHVQIHTNLTLMFAANPKIVHVMWLISIVFHKSGFNSSLEIWPSVNSSSHGYIKEPKFTFTFKSKISFDHSHKRLHKFASQIWES